MQKQFGIFRALVQGSQKKSPNVTITASDREYVKHDAKPTVEVVGSVNYAAEKE